LLSGADTEMGIVAKRSDIIKIQDKKKLATEKHVKQNENLKISADNEHRFRRRRSSGERAGEVLGGNVGKTVPNRSSRTVESMTTSSPFTTIRDPPNRTGFGSSYPSSEKKIDVGHCSSHGTIPPEDCVKTTDAINNNDAFISGLVTNASLELLHSTTKSDTVSILALSGGTNALNSDQSVVQSSEMTTYNRTNLKTVHNTAGQQQEQQQQQQQQQQ